MEAALPLSSRGRGPCRELRGRFMTPENLQAEFEKLAAVNSTTEFKYARNGDQERVRIWVENSPHRPPLESLCAIAGDALPGDGESIVLDQVTSTPGTKRQSGRDRHRPQRERGPRDMAEDEERDGN